MMTSKLPPFSSTNQGSGYHATPTTFTNLLSLLLLPLRTRCLDLDLGLTLPFTSPSLSSAPSELFRHIAATKRIVHSPRCCPICASQFVIDAATTTTVHLCCFSAAIVARAVIPTAAFNFAAYITAAFTSAAAAFAQSFGAPLLHPLVCLSVCLV